MLSSSKLSCGASVVAILDLLLATVGTVGNDGEGAEGADAPLLVCISSSLLKVLANPRNDRSDGAVLLFELHRLEFDTLPESERDATVMPV